MTFFHLKLPICGYHAQSSLGESCSKKLSIYFAESFYVHLIKLHMKKTVQTLVKTKKVLDIVQRDILYNEFFKFFGYYFKETFFFKEYIFRFFAAHELQSTALDPDYGLFIGYQIPANKHEGLNVCLCLLPKNVNNFAKLKICSTHHMNHRSNTEYYECTSGLVLSLTAPCFIRSK